MQDRNWKVGLAPRPNYVPEQREILPPGAEVKRHRLSGVLTFE
jgi:hypothetical protein